jgi:hypothetical protein
MNGQFAGDQILLRRGGGQGKPVTSGADKLTPIDQFLQSMFQIASFGSAAQAQFAHKLLESSSLIGLSSDACENLAIRSHIGIVRKAILEVCVQADTAGVSPQTRCAHRCDLTRVKSIHLLLEPVLHLSGRLRKQRR